MFMRKGSEILAWALAFVMVISLAAMPVSATGMSEGSEVTEAAVEIDSESAESPAAETEDEEEEEDTSTVEEEAATEETAKELETDSDTEATGDASDDTKTPTEETTEVTEESDETTNENETVEKTELVLENSAAESEETTAVEVVEALINALPTVAEVEAMDTDEQKKVYDAFLEACEAYDELSGEEQAQVDDSALNELADYFNGEIASVESLPASGTVTTGEYTLSENMTISAGLTFEEGADVTIDLNGYSITLTGENWYVYGSLTIKDGSADESGSMERGGNTTIRVQDNGELKLVSGTIKVTTYLYSGTSLTVEGGTFGGQYGSPDIFSGASATINGGTFENGISGEGEITIIDGIFNGTVGCTGGGKLTVNGGTFSNGLTTTGGVLTIYDCNLTDGNISCGSGGVLTVYGGTYTYTGSSGGGISVSGGTANIYGGTYDGLYGSTKGTLNIYGGVFHNRGSASGTGVMNIYGGNFDLDSASANYYNYMLAADILNNTSAINVFGGVFGNGDNSERLLGGATSSYNKSKLHVKLYGGAINLTCPETQVSDMLADGASYYIDGDYYIITATYSVSYDVNGGSGTVTDEEKYAAGTTITVASGENLSYNGYEFTGWNTAANGSGDSYAPGETFTLIADTILYAQWKYVGDYTTERLVQLGLIEPWNIKINYRLIDINEALLSADDLNNLYDYGIYFLKESELENGANSDTLSPTDFTENSEVVEYSKSETGDILKITNEGSYGMITATYAKDIYTYQLTDTIYVLFYYQTAEDDEVTYTQVVACNIYDLANERKDSTSTTYSSEEKEVYTRMVNMYDAVTEYRDTFESIEENAVMQAETISEGSYDFNDYDSVSPTSAYVTQVMLIEPWGLQFNGFTTMEEAEDYGAVVYYDLENTYEGTAPDLETLLENIDAYVFSEVDGTASVSDYAHGGSNGKLITARFNSGIYTYQLDTNAYVTFYVKTSEGYHFSAVRTYNVKTLMDSRADSTSSIYTNEEKAVYSAMSGMYEAIINYRASLVDVE